MWLLLTLFCKLLTFFGGIGNFICDQIGQGIPKHSVRPISISQVFEQNNQIRFLHSIQYKKNSCKFLRSN